MGALISADHGFIADSPRCVPERKRKPNWRGIVVIASIVFSVVLAALTMTHNVPIGSMDTKDAKSVPANNSYEFRVYALNQTSSMTTDNGTCFCFDIGDLPFDLCSLQFGDFRTDTNYSLRYFGGSGILVSACGENATLVIRECTGRLISEVRYHGQGLIVLSGETKYSSYPSGGSWNGTDAIVQDWRGGTWAPDDGILIEHPESVSLSEAKFYVMVFEPAGSTQLPEYEVVPVIALTLVLVAFLRNRKASL